MARRRKKTKRRNPVKRRCGKCGRIGHNSQTCKNKKKKTAKKKTAKRKCGKCGKTGHNIQTCKKKRVVKKKTIKKKARAVKKTSNRKAIKKVTKKKGHLSSSDRSFLIGSLGEYYASHDWDVDDPGCFSRFKKMSDSQLVNEAAAYDWLGVFGLGGSRRMDRLTAEVGYTGGYKRKRRKR